MADTVSQRDKIRKWILSGHRAIGAQVADPRRWRIPSTRPRTPRRAGRAGMSRLHLRSGRRRGLIPEPDAVRAVWDDAVAAPDWTGPALWLHGDLHPANVLTADSTICGVIDFGDFAGDPAGDLAAAWNLLPDGAADRFYDASPDTATLRRARGWGYAAPSAASASGGALRCTSLSLQGRCAPVSCPRRPHWSPSVYGCASRRADRAAHRGATASAVRRGSLRWRSGPRGRGCGWRPTGELISFSRRSGGLFVVGACWLGTRRDLQWCGGPAGDLVSVIERVVKLPGQAREARRR